MQYQSLDMERRLICSTRGVQTAEAAHAYSRCDVSVSLASRSPVPALGFRKIRDPTWRKSISNRPNKLDKLNHEQGNSAAALQSILSKATAPLPAMGTSSCIPAQPSSPVNFGRPHPSCVCSLHSQRTARSFAVVYCSSSYWSLMR